MTETGRQIGGLRKKTKAERDREGGRVMKTERKRLTEEEARERAGRGGGNRGNRGAGTQALRAERRSQRTSTEGGRRQPRTWRAHSAVAGLRGAGPPGKPPRVAPPSAAGEGDALCEGAGSQGKTNVMFLWFDLEFCPLQSLRPLLCLQGDVPVRWMGDTSSPRKCPSPEPADLRASSQGPSGAPGPAGSQGVF